MKFSKILLYSLFSDAAYAVWDTFNSNSSEDIAKATNDNLTIPNFVIRKNLGIDPASPWSIPSFHPSDATGFAANVFANGNQKVLAIRGTEPDQTQIFLDVIQADVLEIGLIGMSLSQATSLFNYLQRLRAPRGDDHVLQLELKVTEQAPADLPSVSATLRKGTGVAEQKTVHYWFQPHYTGQGEGVLQAGDQITVTGHSLGGHLAALALRLFPGVFQEAVTFNSGNFDPVTVQFIPGRVVELLEGLAPNSPIKPFVAEGFTGAQQLTEPLVNHLFAAYLPGGPATSFSQVASRLLNYVSEDSAPGDDVDLLAGAVSGRAPASARPIWTEMNSHSMDQIMDSLAVYALLEQLNPALDERKIAGLLDAAANAPDASLERLVGALDKVLQDNDIPLAPVAAGTLHYPTEQEAPGTFNRRSAIHARILALEEIVKTSPHLMLESLVGISASELATRALASAAYRYALLELNPFVLLGDDALYATQPALELARFSPDYLADRAAYLAAEITRRQEDQAHEVHGPVPFKVEDFAHGDTLRISAVEVHPFGAAVNRMPARIIGFGTADGDLAPGSGLRDHLYGEAGNDDLRGQDSEDVLDGGSGADRLQGGAGRDTLWGGEGDDALYGGSTDQPEDLAADILRGGAGFDHYFAGQGDRIKDTDGEVNVVVERQLLRASGQPLRTHFESAALNVYQSSATPALWYLHNPLTRTLQVGGVILEDFTDGDLGISLRGAIVPNPQRTASIGSADADQLQGTAGRDLLRGLAGDDQLSGRAEDDQIFGGEDDDLLEGGPGADELYGEADRDRLYGNDGADLLDGGAGVDVLSGDEGDDVLRGGLDESSDLLMGGAGHDLLFGGPGNDFLSGSTALSHAQVNWTLEFLANPPRGVVRDPRNIRLRGVSVVNQSELFAPQDTAWDALFGEEGDDYLFGSAGDDWLDGGAGDDVISGADGADHLFGGSGQDHLRGGGGADVIDGGEGNDLIVGHGGDESRQLDTDDVLHGGAGADRMYGGPGDDLVAGDDGADILYGDGGRDVLEGGAGADQLFGGEDNDQLSGGDGSDVLFGEDGNDALFGGADHDVLLGEDGDDALFGEDGDDQLLGGDGADALFGGDGDDLLRGGNHNDVLSGEIGADQLFGDSGNDLYLYRAGDGRDEILDASGDNGLWLLDASALSGIETLELGSDLVFRLAPTQEVKIRHWRGEGGVAFLRVGEHGYLARENFLQPTSAGELWTFTGDPAARGTAGDDLVRIAASGVVNAGLGNDRYVIDTPGEIEVRDAQGANTLQFAPGIQLGDLVVTARDNQYLLTMGATNVITTPGQIAHFVFDDGLVLSANEFDTRYAQVVDPAPRVLHPASAQAAFVATRFHYALPSGQFIDLFPGDVLSETVTGRVGGALPGWLHYDPEARAFSGTPTAAGTFEIEIQVRDRRGQMALDRFSIDVLPTLGEHPVAIFEPDLQPDKQSTWVARFGSQTASQYLSGVGDLNHDGIDEVFEPATGRIVFGRREGFGTDYASPDLNGYNGFSLANFDLAVLTPQGGGIERYVPLRGDFNQDGIADVVLGARVLLGRATPYSPLLDYAALPLAQTFTMPAPSSSAPRVRLAGTDLEATSIHAIGDYNGDQRDDYFAWLNEDRGVVIYGVADLSATVEVDAISSNKGFAIDFLPYPGLPGSAAPNALNYANWGTHITALGDLNGDALADFAIGGSPYLFEEQSAFVALVFGARELQPQPLVLSELNGANGLLARIPSVASGIGAPKFAAALGDINGDGYADALIGSSLEPAGSYILYGREKFTGAVAYHTPGDDIIEVTATTPETTAVYAGAGDDRVFIGRSAFGSMSFGGSGNDTLTFAAERGQHAGAGGPGNDRYAVYGGHPTGLYEVHLKDESGANTLFINATAGGSIVLRKGSVALDFGPDFPTIHLDDVDYNDVLGGPRTIDTVEFSDGTSWSYATLIARGFEIEGTALNDDLTGTSVVDRINGETGDDRLAGGRGDDQLRGGTGNDRYVIELVGGADQITDEQGIDVLAWGPGIEPTDLRYASDGAALVISTSHQSVRIADWYHGLSSRIERFQFEGGPELDALSLVNHAPVAAFALPPVKAATGTLFTFKLPGGAFTDPDPFEELRVAVRDPLPRWLTFDATRGTLQGTPGSAEVGTLNLSFVATDLVGTTASAPLAITIAAPTSNRPTAGADRLIGTAGNDRISALAGDDLVRGEAGNDLLYGDAGRDTLEGGPGNDLLCGGTEADFLNGGPGNDLLVGGPGNDVYRFERGAGRDRIFEVLSRDYDVVEFGAGLSARDLSFKRAVGRIEIGIFGTQDTLSVGFDFPGFSPAIDEYRFADGTRLLAKEVSQLAQAMAGFAPISSATEAFRGSDLALASLSPFMALAAPLFHASA